MQRYQAIDADGNIMTNSQLAQRFSKNEQQRVPANMTSSTLNNSFVKPANQLLPVFQESEALQTGSKLPILSEISTPQTKVVMQRSLTNQSR